jgi:LPS-assembly protein
MLGVAILPAQAEILPTDAPFSQCAAEFVVMPRLPFGIPVGDDGQTTRVVADDTQVEGEADKAYTFSGGVTLQRGAQWLQGDRVVYHSAHSDADASGNVNIWQNDLLLTGDQARFSFDKENGTIHQAQFFLKDRHARGDAEQIDIASKIQTTLQRTSYTTCDQQDNSWHLHARSLILNTSDNIGTATHVWIDFMNVPFLYFPYLDFPLAGRKSGLLFPTFGRSGRSGIRVAQPFYWNIAPDRDATFTVQNFSARGRQLLGEFRYLNPQSNGQFNFEYLPQDKIANLDRSYVAYAHNWSPGPAWTAGLNYRYASDKDYFVDFGDRLSTATTLNLERTARLSYRGDIITAQAAVVDYQTLDDRVIYKKLPELTLRALPQRDYLGLRPQLSADAVRFEQQSAVSGTRVTMYPGVSYPLESVAGFVRPKLGVHATKYALTRQAADTANDPGVATPVFSTDIGLIFERDLDFNARGYVQTLEPRLYYLYVPYRGQKRLLVDHVSDAERCFDCGLNALSYTQLFADNRFSGGDRIGDANQFSLALTTRVLDLAGVERLSASIGQIHYLRDREVTLPGVAAGSSIDTAPRSDLVGELRAHVLRNLDVSSTLQWNSTLAAYTQANLLLRYQPHKRKIMNFGVRLTRDATTGTLTQQELDASVVWPLLTNWNLIARRNYSLLDTRDKEWIAGLEYDGCCWALRAVSHGYVLPGATPHPALQNSFMLQLELKGLASVGQDITTLLEKPEHGIAGY